MHTREKKSVWLSRAVRLTDLFRGKGKTVMTFDCCIKKQKYGMKCLQQYEIFKKNALKRKTREKILFDVRASEDCYNDLQEIIQTLNWWLS